jgi:hypothetical protein
LRVSFRSEAAASSSRAARWRKFLAGKKKLSELRNHQSFAAELIFEPRRALGRENAHGIIYIQADSQIACFFGDRNWRGHYEWSKNVELRGIRQTHVNAAEIQRDSVDGIRFEQSQFCRAAYIYCAAARKI